MKIVAKTTLIDGMSVDTLKSIFYRPSLSARAINLFYVCRDVSLEKWYKCNREKMLKVAEKI